MYYGADYNPEQWPEETWPDDVRRMQEAGVNLVSLAIFSWAKIQPAEGEFEWGWLDRILGLLHDGGIQVNLATATASPPPWATQKYPEMLPADQNGAVYGPGSRQHYAPTSPAYRRLAADLVAALAARYATHPAVVMWHVNNEYGCHLNYDYSDNARDAFQHWLRRKYGTIEGLNAAWGTAFWSQIYTSFDQILPPRKAPYSTNPGGALDYKRFTSDALLELYVMERDTIRAAGATQPITTNFMGAFPPLDYWKWAQEVDVIADDCYPDPNDPESFRTAAFARDLMRSLKPGTPWLLMEQSTGALNWRPTNAPKAPGQMAALSAQAVGHGADAVMFFQWRQSRRGSEKFHSAMLPQSGTGTRIWREVTHLGSTLAEIPTLAPDSGARVALVFDWESWWALSHTDYPVPLDYSRLIQRWYAALHSQHVSIDIVKPTSDLTGYKLVVAPQLYLLTNEGAENLSTYTTDGGHLFVSAFTDVVDEDDAFRDGGYLVGLRDLLGISIDEFGALVPPSDAGDFSSAGATSSAVGGHGPGQAHSTVQGPFGEVRGEYFAEELRPHGAEVIGSFTDGRLAGHPALTRNSHGTGVATYLATIPDDTGMVAAMAWALREAGVLPEVHGLSPWIETARRADVLTLINHGTEKQTVSVRGTDILTGEEVSQVKLGAFDWRMIRTEPA
ncbi:beta-galactosidase [Paenarthrobacter sp. CM16]|uniref:beta-galactosidase n=1 Tax=Paenarthrobacter sp. CM16 TaxID=2738447 RepID=UPI001555CDF9|nr:beta-galactosidase [Paenarthrobacter sp. CM16]NQD86886.1 beta-galactosidase [Paenarthrobacter sp. CM16]